ncbi:MAG: glycosyltransferase family 9 protein, partial [Bdellovibrionales bacterium]|nr:glycosyltransferase family 9 protein [Bdellovibrionales bacterium]
MKKRYPKKSNVLLVNITRLGDMLQATPTIAGIKEENPGCRVTVLVEKQFESICHWLPHIDEVMTIDLGMMVRSLARNPEGVLEAYDQVTDLLDDLRSRNFDYCLNMSSSAYTALLLKMVNVQSHGGWTADEEGHRVIESDWAKLFATSVFHQNRQFNSINLVDVFRCSADVEAHPESLQININPDALTYVDEFLAEHKFTNTGPLIAVQAGASQEKRQFAPKHFIECINILTTRHNARVVLTGTNKELPIIDPIMEGCDPANVVVAAGKTNIQQLAALLHRADVLLTGDTGPMHVSVAAGTPVISMFLASAYGYETGPYSPGNIILQPVIVCGPCNPNKPCARPDCHDHIDPAFLAELVRLRAAGEITSLPPGLADPNKVIVYRTVFDDFGFMDLEPLNSDRADRWAPYRKVYRKLWLDDLAGYQFERNTATASALAQAKADFPGLENVIQCAQEG